MKCPACLTLLIAHPLPYPLPLGSPHSAIVGFVECPDYASSLLPCALMSTPNSHPCLPRSSGLTLPNWLEWFHPTDLSSMSLPPEIFPLFSVWVRSSLVTFSICLCVYVMVFILISQSHSSRSSKNPHYQFMYSTE